MKVSPAREGLKKAQRAKTTIAVSAETISLNLDSLDAPTRMMALVELIRRLTRRLETEALKAIEQLHKLQSEEAK